MTISRQQIEAKREELYQLASERGLSDPEVLAKSKELDHLLNVYQHQKDMCKINPEFSSRYCTDFG